VTFSEQLDLERRRKARAAISQAIELTAAAEKASRGTDENEIVYQALLLLEDALALAETQLPDQEAK
jgi:hypothetical protein